ncbi:hypothetical protein AWB67_05093 [Caballeronia terrestris]|uniref:Uncharacterized protein n=2 Tax=Caballeronia terrestris TaxID=1226301 RepID=A0A158KAH2_9BURK|nr:hypothetical protein AWB67_05093 [Caballeronia terrestris]
MQPFYQNASQLAARYTVLINELNRYPSGNYPTVLCLDVLHLIHDTNQWLAPDRHECVILDAARTLAEGGDPKRGLFELHKVISARLR